MAYDDVERLRDALQRGEERVFATSLYLLLRAPTPEGLDEITRRTEAILDGMLAQSRVAYLEQEGGLRACLPLADDRLLAYRNLDTSSLATAFPFSAHTLSMAGGVLRRGPPRPGPGHRRPLRRQPGERQHGRDRHLRRRQELQHQADRPAPPPAGGRRPGRRPRGRVPPAVRAVGAVRPPQRHRPARPPQPPSTCRRRDAPPPGEAPPAGQSGRARTGERRNQGRTSWPSRCWPCWPWWRSWSPPPRRPSAPRSGGRSTGPSTPPTPEPGYAPSGRPTPPRPLLRGPPRAS